MKRDSLWSLSVLLVAASVALATLAGGRIAQNATQVPESEIVQLPSPRYDSGTSVEKALNMRRSARSYSEEPLSLSDISQILWAAQGITRRTDALPTKWNPKYEWQGGNRTAPSAGALYPMELFLIAGKVGGMPAAVYKYLPKTHSLKKVMNGDKRSQIYDVALKQSPIKEASALLMMTAVYERTAPKYGNRTERYVHMEAGFIGENVYLQTAALGIGTVMIGAFQDEGVRKVLDLPGDESPLAIMPLGKIRKE